ncbi:MAG: SEC-C metal-binding domain-containing protein [Simkaniaceae bacterium]|nr:SEC-C metal-binding domain-containing protein [Simkaniaceae bacterium]
MEKVGRNDPCPCGSGKKFKKCHGKQSSARPIIATQIDSSKFSNLFSSHVAPSAPTEEAKPLSERIGNNEKTSNE